MNYYNEEYCDAIVGLCRSSSCSNSNITHWRKRRASLNVVFEAFRHCRDRLQLKSKLPVTTPLNIHSGRQK